MSSNDHEKGSIELHERLKGKIELRNKMPVKNEEDLSTVYSPGVAAPSQEIYRDPRRVRDLTMKSNTIAVVSDGSAVLGLGDIGPSAALPVMEGKSMLFKQFAGIDAVPLCLDARDVDALVGQIAALAPSFGGINLEDISAPRCFEIEARLQDIGIPVFHDDQHGTAIVAMAGIINACKLVDKKLEDLKVVISGAGAAGVAIAKLLNGDADDPSVRRGVDDIILCDSKGIISSHREDLNAVKEGVLDLTNVEDREGDLEDALEGADVFIGVSRGDILDAHMMKRMARDPIIFALSNPTPEIDPQEAKKGGAVAVATGRSDHPNQVNNVLVFPAIFRAALDMEVPRIDETMKLRAAFALAEEIPDPTPESFIPQALDPELVHHITENIVGACVEAQKEL